MVKMQPNCLTSVRHRKFIDIFTQLLGSLTESATILPRNSTGMLQAFLDVPVQLNNFFNVTGYYLLTLWHFCVLALNFAYNSSLRAHLFMPMQERLIDSDIDVVNYIDKAYFPAYPFQYKEWKNNRTA